MQSPFHVDQVIDLTVGNRKDNKVFRAQVMRCDEKDLVLLVPGFDPLHFVDLLKGTEVVLGVQQGEERYVFTSRMTRHFKNTSPYLVVRRPGREQPIRRVAVARIHRMLDIEYKPGGSPMVRTSRTSGEGARRILLTDVPEPFDVGTPLDLTVRRRNSKNDIRLTGRVSAISRDSGANAAYQIELLLDRIEESQVGALLEIVLSAEEREDDNRIEPLET